MSAFSTAAHLTGGRSEIPLASGHQREDPSAFSCRCGADRRAKGSDILVGLCGRAGGWGGRNEDAMQGPARRRTD
eukprot:3718604-Prymnesium_polylepis.2